MTEAQLSAAEDVCGPYVWGVYDLLVLPPSFPFGGMENPCLTFVTPTLIAGDRSLVDVIAHEIAHSWTGNLVTNSNFEHFWLNEGFTVFVERKIVGRLHGEPFRHFAAIGGKTYLADTIESMGASNPLTSLMPDLTGIDPDDSFSTVPYEKGQAFLWYLEELVGGPGEFDPFLKSYIANFQYRSIETDDFVQYLKHYFQNTAAAEKLEKVDWQTWFHSPGMPPTFANYDDSLAVPCKALCQLWSDWNNKGCPEPISMSPEDLKTLSPSQIQEFLAQLLLGPPLSCQTIEKMQQIYGLNGVQNAEIKLSWCIPARHVYNVIFLVNCWCCRINIFSTMAEEEAIFDPSLKKKKKKAKKTPFDFDAALAGGTAGNEPAEVEVGKENENPEEEEIKEVDDLDLESFGKKKKKSKKKAFPIEDLEVASPEVEGQDGEAVEDQEDLDLDFSKSLKKKKKKKITGAVEEEKDEKEESTGVAWTTDGDYTYDELLNRVFNIMREKNPEMVAGEKKKFTMRPPQVVRIGTKKTSFANFSEICKMLHRQPKHVLAFLLAELGTSGSVDGNNQLIIKGRFQQKQMENVLRRYVKEYVTCHTCRSPDTILQKDTRLFFLQCETCGSRCSVASIKSGFQAVTGKRAAIRAKTA
uniref:Eukaryotic translation initiation factor 2 subunit 2 n=3 Tax=Daphnia magna TaxID=35525 RepID=A0A4Y7MJI3_9CRUS|nr:EOG090X0AVX [Daphnia magna]